MADGEEQRAKAALRRRVRLARAGTSALARAGTGEALARTALGAAPVRRLLEAGDGTVLAYAAVPGEPDPGALRERLRSAGARVVLPVVTGPQTLAWARDTGRLAPGHELPGGRRLPEPDPVTAVPLADLGLGPLDLVLVPALAVGRDGARLGQGGGFYDRALAHLQRHPSGPLVVAVVHDEEVLDVVPAGPHDLRVDAVLTPSAWVRTGVGRTSGPPGRHG